ncbi:MAG: alpha/beta hydrolase [Pirellulaceae bacterium]|jgi:acetyl esterase/lipase|nr:alpha/beta hydrolase [Pirellulaceae bacterium]MDP7015359.1 alpha/beta hydrolase [Pirellulaceae bacterium]
MKSNQPSFAARALYAIAAATVLAPAGWTFAQDRQAQPARATPSRKEVYKKVGDIELKMDIFEPASKGARRPAVVFFFGGGWRNGSTKQFYEHSRQLAKRGVVCFCAEYRVESRHKATVPDCIADAKSAVRWIRANAERLRVDPRRLAAGGGSAGGHLAAAVALVPEFSASDDPPKVSCVPNALLLFNPALNLERSAFGDIADQRYQDIRRRVAVDPSRVSPSQHVQRGAPPTLIMHGKADTTVPYGQAEEFAAKMKKVGARCEVSGYEGQPHGFFNFGRSKNRYFTATMKDVESFLTSLDYLPAK